MDIPEEFLHRILIAVDYYTVYLKATNRDRQPFLEVSEFIMKRKGQDKEVSSPAPRKKRA